MKIIDTSDVLLIGWLCFYFFKGIKLFPWWIFILLCIFEIAFQSIGNGIAEKLNKNKIKWIKNKN